MKRNENKEMKRNEMKRNEINTDVIKNYKFIFNKCFIHVDAMEY